jgi:hypothetical protein
MSFKLLGAFDYPSFRCNQCDVIACSNMRPTEYWSKLSAEGWLRRGRDRNLCARCANKIALHTFERTCIDGLERGAGWPTECRRDVSARRPCVSKIGATSSARYSPTAKGQCARCE